MVIKGLLDVGSHPILSSLGGEGGIRTHDTLAGIQLFESCAFNHSATSPCVYMISWLIYIKKSTPSRKVMGILFWINILPKIILDIKRTTVG